MRLASTTAASFRRLAAFAGKLTLGLGVLAVATGAVQPQSVAHHASLTGIAHVFSATEAQAEQASVAPATFSTQFARTEAAAELAAALPAGW